jgi:D-xylonolactonase
MTEIRMIWNGEAVLGEGPVWDERDCCLWFVDIKQRFIHRLDPVSGESRSWQAPTQVGWVLPARTGGFLAGLQGGLYHFTPDDGGFRCVAEIEKEQPRNRLNDATIAPDGTVWFGTMDDGVRDKTGSVYRWDGATAERTSIPLAVVTNGPGITPDGGTLYHVDTVEGVVQAVPLGPKGPAGPGRNFIRIDPADGFPDGAIVDAVGNIWIGIWGGACARCYAPDGNLLRQVDIPAPNVTKVALGGDGLTTAFVTTARADLDSATLARQPGSGAVFAFEVDTPGQSYPLAPMQ